MTTEVVEHDDGLVTYYPPGPNAASFHNDHSFVRGIMGPVGCLPADTEFLTPTGWKRIDSYQEGDQVAVWSDGLVKYEAAEYVKLPAAAPFYRFDSGSLVMELSPEHRVLAHDWKGERVVKTAEQLANKPSKHTIPTTFLLAAQDSPMSDDEIRLRVMLSADGHIPKSGNQVSVTVRKPRKLERLRWMLDQCGVIASESKYDRGGASEYCLRFQWPYGDPDKSLAFVWSLSSRQLDVVIQECLHWDGLHNHAERRYYTTVPANADAIQYAAHACGYRATIKADVHNSNWKTNYTVSIRIADSVKNNAMVRCDSTRISRFEPEDGWKYCFTTSTGFFVARCQGTVFITGNSGKSSSCCAEIVMRACKQQPWYDGVRRSRWAIIRNTYPELKSTTIKTWQTWFPQNVAPIRWDTPITSTMRIDDIGDGTAMELEVIFLALDSELDTGKLRSLELTGVWINEASEISKAVFDMCTQRVGRYPSKLKGGPSWTGVIMDTNPPDDDHWYYQIAEMETPKGWKFFRQPGGLYRDEDGVYHPNPDAENIDNLPSGHEYYLRQLGGKQDTWVNVFLMGNYGTTSDGKPVYPEWNDRVHVSDKKLEPVRGLPIILGWDFGLTPACIIGQQMPNGRLVILEEIISEDMGIRQFTSDIVRPILTNKYNGFQRFSEGDPAGQIRAQTDERTCLQELLELGIPTEPAATNDWIPRRESVAFFLTRMIDGGPGLLLDPSCSTLRKGFNGRYRYERVKSSGAARYRDRPVKDAFSHPHDALQYLCMRVRNGLRPTRARSIVQASSKGWT